MGLFQSAWYAVLAATLTNAHSHHDQSALCQHPAYQSHLVSTSPLVIYLEGFLTPEEQTHLKTTTQDTFSRSGVSDQDGVQGQRRTRTSQSTSVASDDTVRCIEERAVLFQGFDVPRTHLEPLQLVKYGRGEHYHFHTDWFTSEAHASSVVGGNRQTSFFAYVAADNVTGG
ncbi:hypothetical protein EKO27_g12065, partial [Xylaria grammica]